MRTTILLHPVYIGDPLKTFYKYKKIDYEETYFLLLEEETYFWVKQGGTFIDTACSRDSIP